MVKGAGTNVIQRTVLSWCAVLITPTRDHCAHRLGGQAGKGHCHHPWHRRGPWRHHPEAAVANEFHHATRMMVATSSLVLLLSIFCFVSPVRAVQIRAGQLTFNLNRHSGGYDLQCKNPAMNFKGSVGMAVSGIRISSGDDRIGAYQRLTFQWQQRKHLALQASVRLYLHRSVALFAMRFLQAADHPWIAFPDFSSAPQDMHVFSYRNRSFSPPQFRAGQSGTPWLLFNNHLNAAIISPASHFLVTTMSGDGRDNIGVCLNAHITGVPAKYRIRSLVSVANGINPAWDIWGHTLTNLTGATRPSNEADWALRYIGYWTSNGCGYFCHFNPKLGYAGTLLGEIRHLHHRNIPVRYLQLDGMFSVDGVTPANRVWFPLGLKAFRQELGIPLAVYGTIAPRVDWSQWQRIAAYSRSRGAVLFEHDFLRLIYKQAQFDRHLNRGSQFFGGMAKAMSKYGLSIMYCMPAPCEIMQAAKYPNVTTCRVSNDFFVQPRWREFVFTSRLAGALGIWPWTDACLSTSRYGILLQTLSAGMVGFGDLRGHESRAHIMPAIRADGVIVKPDVPLVPTGQSYLNEVRHPRRPIVARTYTEQNGVRTVYVFAFDAANMRYWPWRLVGKPGPVARGNIPKIGYSAYIMPTMPYSKIIADYHRKVQFYPSQMGLHGTVYVYNYFTRRVTKIPSNGKFIGRLGKQRASYYVCAATGPSGIAFIGALRQYVGTGKARIPDLNNQPNALSATVAFARGEHAIDLGGFAAFKPIVHASGGAVGLLRYRKATGAFSVNIMPSALSKKTRLDGQPVREVVVRFSKP